MPHHNPRPVCLRAGPGPSPPGSDLPPIGPSGPIVVTLPAPAPAVGETRELREPREKLLVEWWPWS
ncbi:hypothetical protein ACFV1L_20730 [Kitasatospora sp. NPDC059646]|uniref:hypothetical protein n=1 Tax=Kitasatospora sp. NPDC059646 TaxID=3346893 RepID=UPI0036CC8672